MKNLKSYYTELLEFKSSEDFKKYGFAKGGKNHKWLSELKELSNNPDIDAKTNISVNDLIRLGMAYVTSYGKETPVTESLNSVLKEL